ncbi:putative occludin domain-containing protein [Lupinus albus]|uniref:Putative occludin domain-containing protein n=1 Tax=Lupinus albus TaxID=3870 RepID=A0A6A4PAZ3_LUPAL|nr:putative occludin domain-containing protein [Lupinus albus]
MKACILHHHKSETNMVEKIMTLEAHEVGQIAGVIIDVGGKQFRFTWSQEFGDLCDIYEERQSGEDGNGLLVESGCALRKLNVQRTLDESTKNHVKMRSEEAERKHKSRKAIVLEPGNPSVKALAAAEATQRKSYNKMKGAAPPKKSKVETLQVGGHPKSSYRPGFSSTTATMSTGKHSSPLSFPPDQSAASSSPLGAINISKGIDNGVPSQKIGKQTGGPDKEVLTKTNSATRNSKQSRGKNIVEPVDLKNIIVSLLMDKPGGMTLKALVKALNGIVPDPKKKMEPIMRKIASYKSPGKYFLLPGVDLENFKKPLTKSGSSTGDNHPQQSAHQEFFDESPAPQGDLKENNPDDGLEELMQLNSKLELLSKTSGNINEQCYSPDILNEKKGPDLSEGQEGNSSDRESDGDRESGGRSHSGSGSMSTAERENRSGCDSENGTSSNSEEVPCRDVDAVTNNYDERESKNKTEASAKRVLSLVPGNLPDGRSLQYEIETHEKQHNNESNAIETGTNLPAEPEAELALTTATISMDSSRHEQFGSRARLSGGKRERDSSKNICVREEKRSKAEYSGQAQSSLGTDVQMFETTHSFSPIHASGKVSKNPGDASNRSKQSLSMDSHCLKQGEAVERSKDARPGTHHVHCDSNPDEFLVTKLFEQKNSSETTLEPRKPFSALVTSGFHNMESTNKGITDILSEETTRPLAATVLPHPQQRKAVNVDIESQKKSAEMSGGLRCNESEVRRGIYLEGRKDNNNAPANASSPNSLKEVADGVQSSGVADNNNNKDWRKYLSDENASYLKYEKADAELKGPIMSFSQYQEYVHEFREKHDTYMYLNKACASYEDVFQELVNGLNDAKDDEDMHNSIFGKLMESYETYGMKHKRQKRIYVVLHRELESIKQRIKEFVETR